MQNTDREKPMRKILFILALCYNMIVSGTVFGTETERNKNMKIKLSFDDKEVIVRMEDNPAVMQFLELLPANFEFIDFAGEEKITDFPRPLSLNNAPRGMVALAGKMFIYAPWGNMGFFYKNHGSTLDSSLIPLGEVESGLEYLAGKKGGFPAKIEILEK